MIRGFPIKTIQNQKMIYFPSDFSTEPACPPPACSLHLNTSALHLARQVQWLVTDRGRRTAGGTQSCRGPGSQPATQPGYDLWLRCGMSQTSRSPDHRPTCALLADAMFTAERCTASPLMHILPAGALLADALVHHCCRPCTFLCTQLHHPSPMHILVVTAACTAVYYAAV